MALECNGFSTHEWVRVWGINTPLSKTSRCSVRLRLVRPVPQTGQIGQFKLTSRWTQTGQTGQLDRSDRSQKIFCSQVFLSDFSHMGWLWALLVMSNHWCCIPLNSTASYAQVHIKWHTHNTWDFMSWSSRTSSINILRLSTSLISVSMPAWASDFESYLHIRMKSVFDSQVTPIF